MKIATGLAALILTLSAPAFVAYAGVCEPCATVDCSEGEFPVDRDGDGCTESCEPRPIQ